jgi:ribonuclease HI
MEELEYERTLAQLEYNGIREPDVSHLDVGPRRLSDGRYVCYRHHRGVCGTCSVDYSHLDEELGYEEEDDDMGYEEEPKFLLNGGAASFTPMQSLPVAQSKVSSARQHSNEVLDCHRESKKYIGILAVPTNFYRPSRHAKPLGFFRSEKTSWNYTRYISHAYSGMRPKCLVFTAGACFDFGQPNVRAGWAVATVELTDDDADMHARCNVSGRLEKKGPYYDEERRSFYYHFKKKKKRHHHHDKAPQTNNRAELRAAIAALELRDWRTERLSGLVIATTSPYVFYGATQRVKTWVADGQWKDPKGVPVTNRDLLEYLFCEIIMMHIRGFEVEFRLTDNECNTVAEGLAKEGVEKGDAPECYTKVSSGKYR